jgi:hypothetical protein
MAAKTITSTDVNKAFESGAVYTASDEELVEYLRVLNSTGIANPAWQHCAINRATTINTLINLRYFKRVDRSNTIVTWVVVALAAVEIVVSLLR